MLWLVGKEYSSDSFPKEYSQSNTNLFYGFAPPHCTKRFQSYTNLFNRSTPLPSIRIYRQKKREEDRKLRLNEYSPTFLRWAQCYLQHKPASIIEAGGSLMDLLFQKIGERISAVNLKRRPSARRSARSSLSKPASLLTWNPSKESRYISYLMVMFSSEGQLR